MDEGVPLKNIFRALPSAEVILFVWSNEAFAFATRHVRDGGKGAVKVASEECPMQSSRNRWVLTSPYYAIAPSKRKGHAKGVVKSLLGVGPYWIIINMAYYATIAPVLDLFTEVALLVKEGDCCKLVSCNTPEYALAQLRQWQGQLPPSVYWLPDVMPHEGVDEPLPQGGVGNNWWTTLLKGTQVPLFDILQDDFDPDLDFLPHVQEPYDDNQ